MNAIVGESIRAERKALSEDPIVDAMAADIADGISKGFITLGDIAHDDGTPRFEFMQRANRHYAERGGKNSRTIGGVAHVIIDKVSAKEGN